MLNISIKNNLSDEEEDFLLKIWSETIDSLLIPANEAEPIFDQIRFEYADWKRSYHNLSHLVSLFRLYDTYKEQLKDPGIFAMALWFHDFVYDSKRQDNEAQSAKWAEELLKPYLNRRQMNQLTELIMSTARHKIILDADLDNAWLLDFDLAVLATDAETYRLYSDAIREEYKSWYSFFVYNMGRKKVLKQFLERDTIYFTAEFKEKYEAKARENLVQEIKDLSK